MTVSAVPWDWSATTGGWIYAVEVSYLTAAGERATARWCGPPSRCGSGLAAAIGSVIPQQWEARIRGARYSRDLGGLRQHVQVASTLSLRVDLAGPTDPLFAALRDGRWTDREAVAWFYDRDTGAWVEMARGLVRRGRELTVGGARLSIIAGPLLLGEPWPMTRLPEADYNEAVDEHQVAIADWPGDGGIIAEGGAGSYVNPNTGWIRDHSWHPNIGTVSAPPYFAFRLIGDHAGRYVGPVWGNGNTVSTTDRVWREVVPYGTTNDPVFADWYFFFHISPQFGCYVHEMAWLDTDVDPTVIRLASDTYTFPPRSVVQTFNNRDPDLGPVGTNCRLLQQNGLGAGVPEWSGRGQEARFYARISGPTHSIEDTDEAGAIEVLSASGSIEYMDHNVIDDAFALLGQPQALAPGATTDFALAAELGPESGFDWRRFVCAVPRLIVEKPPSVREVLGDLMRVLGADLVQRASTTGPLAGTQRLFPRRRRPSPSHPEADWTIRPGQLVEPDPGDWSISDDAEADYASRVLVTSPDFGQGPADTDGDGILDALDPVDRVRLLHDDDGEQALAGAVVSDDEKNTYWLAFPGGEADGMEWQGSTRSQLQPWVTARLGSPHYAADLADTVGYEVPGLLAAVGQIRGLDQDWDRLHVEVRSVHVQFHGGAVPPGSRV